MTTNTHPAHGPVSLERLHQISEILSKAAAQSDGGNLGYAMADAVKVIDGAIAAFGAEPVAIAPVMYKGIELLKKDGLELIRDGIAEATELESMCMAKALLSAQPARVVSEWTNEQCLEFLSIAFRHAEIKGDLELDDIRLGMKMVNESRAAMIQAGNSPVIPDRRVANKVRDNCFGYLRVSQGNNGKLLVEYDQFIFDQGSAPENGKFIPKHMLQGIINRLQEHCDELGEEALVDIFEGLHHREGE